MTNMAQPSVIDERLVGGECRFGDVFLTRFGHTLQGERPHGRLGLHFPTARPAVYAAWVFTVLFACGGCVCQPGGRIIINVGWRSAQCGESNATNRVSSGADLKIPLTGGG